MVQFGIFDHIEGMPGTDMGQLLRDRLDLIKMADQAGFHAYHLAEHHGTDLCMAPNQEIFLAAAAQVTSTIRLGPLVKILPLHHPLRVIEDICMLDQLTDGGSSTASGGASPPSSTSGSRATGSSRANASTRRSPSSCAACGPASPAVAGGKHYDFPEISLTLRPVQTPNPPMWYPGNPTVAGRYGFGLVWPGAIPQEAYDLYVSTWERVQGRPGAGRRARCRAARRVDHADRHRRRRGRREGDRGARFRGLMRRSRGGPHLRSARPRRARGGGGAQPVGPRGAQALVAPGGEAALMPMLTADSGTASQVTERCRRCWPTVAPTTSSCSCRPAT